MKKLLFFLCLSALLLAGCGDSGDGDGGSVDTAGEGTSEADTDFTGEGGEDFCNLAKKFEEDFEDTAQPGADTDMAKELKELTAAIDKLADEAPGEIEDDTKKIAKAFGDYNDLLAKYDYDFSKVPAAEQKEISVGGPDVEAASNRVESYFEKVCKMDSDDDGDTDGVIEDDRSSDDSTSTEGTEPTDGEQAPADETEVTTGE